MKVLTKKEPEKKLVRGLRKKGGRGKSGRITVRHKGGGVKRLYRQIEFGQGKLGEVARVEALEYDPNRTAFLALLKYQDGERCYILAPRRLKVGDEVIFSEKTSLKSGNRQKLKNVPVGTLIYNIEITPGRGGKLVRGAGTSAQVMAQEGSYTHLKMPSGELRKLLNECFSSMGEVSNPEHRFRKLGKAGRSRLKGRRPTVRGSAMVPAAHPHGGGEGKAGIGLKHPKTPWGKLAKGGKTRRKKWTDKLIIQRRKRKK